ncbi:RNA polymerase sigma factor [Miltoncostaea oceani]|uniref:RNA polymerase sigma factor n=1 Tax=Miltoncostaea oceani TaxID=2843216 RepID=UPI001C3C241F|nr:RNA polymerase sigma factor [Miltoncostaea oceani]
MDALSDPGLVAAALDGDAEARGALFTRHWRMVWRRAYTVTGRQDLADDVTQDTFERAFRHLATFDRERASFGAWIARIAVNRSIDLLRAERRTLPIDAALEVGAWDAEPGGDRALQAALARVDVDRRSVLVLRYWLDLSGAEIAETLGVPIGTVNSRMSRGLSELRALLEGGDA